MHKRNANANFDISQIFLDIVTIMIAYLVAIYMYKTFQDVSLLQRHFWMVIMFTVIFVLSMFLSRMYNITTFYYNDRIIVRTMVSTMIAGFCLSMVIFMLKLEETSRLLFLLFCITSFIMVIIQRVLKRFAYKAHWLNGVSRVAFIGTVEAYNQYQHYIGQTAMKYKFVGILPHGDFILNSTADFEQYIIQNQLDEVVMVYGQNNAFDYEKRLKICEEMGITVRLVLDLFNMPAYKHFVSSIGTYPVVTYHNVSLDQLQIFIKSIFDFFASLIGLILFSPIFIFTAVAIKLESPGPVFFKQARAGLNGKVFHIYKFRSMYIDAEERKQELMAQNKIQDGLMFKIDDDPRITKVGKFIRKASIDELPQFINVLKGDMSLVGTRPPTLDEVKKYKRDHRRRISIKPGITGMWQVSGRSTILDFEQVVKLDCKYIDQWSLALDFKLLFKTVFVVFSQRGSC